MVDFFQNFGYSCSNVCLPSANLKSIAAMMLIRYHIPTVSSDARKYLWKFWQAEREEVPLTPNCLKQLQRGH